jgi:hypothetical protein
MEDRGSAGGHTSQFIIDPGVTLGGNIVVSTKSWWFFEHF